MSGHRRNAGPNCIHHVVNRGNRKKPIFLKPQDYHAFVDVLREAVARFEMRLLSFCVMKNHWHLVLWPDERVSISAFMHWLTSTHVVRYHRHYGLRGTGHLYQAPYRNDICTDDRGLLSIMRYVEGNPVAAGLVKRAQDWQWSSLRIRLDGEDAGLLATPPIPLPDNWAEFVTENTPLKSAERRPPKE